MYEFYSKVIGILDDKQLEDIFKINKLTAKGFRISAQLNAGKVKKMKKALAEFRNLEPLLKKAAETYSLEKNRDYTWALVSTLDENIVKKKIEESSIGDVAFALIHANKEKLLEKFLEDDQEEKTVSKKTEDGTDKEELIKNLRGIITNLEEEIKRLERDKRRLEVESNQTNDTLKEFRKNNLKLKNQNDELKKKKNEAEKEKRELEELLDIIKDEITTTELENQKLQKLRILFYGNKFYEKYITNQVAPLHSLIYEYASGCIDELEDYDYYQKLVILSFTLNKKERKVLFDTKAYKYFEDTFNTAFIPSIEKLNEYITNLGCYYE